MNTIIDIVNQSKHPIDSDEYIQYCNDEIKKNSILILNDFLTNDCLSELITEAHGLQDQAFYCSQNHTILLNKQDKLSDLNDPLNREVVSDKGCVPHDLLNQQSKLTEQIKNTNPENININIDWCRERVSFRSERA